MGDQQNKDRPNPSLEFLVKYSSKLAHIQRKLKNKQNSDVNYYDDLHDVKESIKKSKQIDEFDPDAVQELLNVVQNILNQHKKTESGKDKALLDEFTELLSNDRYNITRKNLLESPPHDKNSVPIGPSDPNAVQELLNKVENILNQHKKSKSVKHLALLDEFTELLSNDRYNITRKKLLESPPHDKNSVPTCPSDPNAAQELLNKVENILNQHKKSESGKDIALLDEFTELLSNDRDKETRKKLLESPHHEDSVPICPFDIKKPEILNKAYDELEDVEKKCLIFSFTLFNNVDLNVEVRKRELIHWWMGMEYVSDYYNGEKVLEKLSQRHFIVKKRKFRIRSGRDNMAGRSTRYNMEDKTLKCLLKLIEERMCHCIRDVNRDLKETSVVINMSTYIFSDDILNKLSKEKAKILHLGSWNSSMDYLVLVDDDQGLFSFKTEPTQHHTQEVNVLSIQGISRIKELSPDLLFNLTNLKVLDLRSCQDLENLPYYLHLQNLICLDLSECYQLNPINIKSNSCPQLQVLKGFIIPINGSDFISKLSHLKRLVKLTIYNKNKNFPTEQDVKDLCSLEQLRKLKVVWVLADTDRTKQDTDQEKRNDYSLSQNYFPKKLEKLELESGPKEIVAELLRVISEMKDNCCVQKLYIRGGTLSDLDHIKLCFPSIKIVNLRYLPNLKLKWDDFLRLFPNLSYLEVLLCPKLENFPCDDIKTWNNSDSN